MGSENHSADTPLMMRKPVGRIAITLLALVLLAARAYPQVTENLDIIWTIPGDTTPDCCYFGSSLASGDVNGDGMPDIAVAWDTFDANGPMPKWGRVYVYYGDHVGDTTPDLILKSPYRKGANYPWLACGDLNADGFGDIAMAEDMSDDGYGLCTVWMGGDPMDTIPDVVIRGRSCWWLNSLFGSDVSVGDVNGDGHDDLVVGAYCAVERPGDDQTGRVYVFYGGPSFDTIPDVTLKGGHDGESEGFGIGVSAEGDFDHDGFHDIYVGAWQYGSDRRGRVYVYYGGDPMDTSSDMAMSGEGAAHFFGFERPGALNAQGSFDYAVEGNELWPHGAYSSSNCGKVYVHQGGRPMDSIPDVSLIGRMDSANLGYSAQSAGDATGDGNDDLVGGAPYLPPCATGAAYLWETGNHFDTVPDAWMMGEPNRKVGMRVRTAGDLDGDGSSEFLVASYTSIPPARVWVCKYTGSGVQEEEAVGMRRVSALHVYPSPCQDRVWITCPWNTGENSTLRICDVTGRVVRTLALGLDASRLTSQSVQWDLRDAGGRRVNSGVYIVLLERDNGEETSRCSAKVIVERQ